MTPKNLEKSCNNVQSSGNACSNCSQDKKYCCNFSEIIINQILELQSAYFKWANTINTVIKNAHKVNVVTFTQAINKELKTVLTNISKETPSVNDKPDTLNGKVVKALQEISTILKEIQKIQETNFIAVSDIKNALNLKCFFNSASNSEAKRTCLSFSLPQTVSETLTLIRSLQFSLFSIKQQSMAPKSASSSHNDAKKNNADNKNADNKNADKNNTNKNINNKNANEKSAENKNTEKADANVTSDVSSEDFQN
ncbi:uncharacterized protein CIMG_12854 [Coccidioides immitis RS]|uniref:Uncharacterized protein n=1 Tax=Coccidioides immitis (strain RS) TaxID=246410 RepID=J3KHB7_COCIM|nr:uncharacterized protein CIMG_12854 [Coccidioides immitis RS]EAS35234.3 hypothetical protein CIMG_12854 [Coccidioides immitis RS]